MATLAAAIAALGVVMLGSSDAEDPAAVRADCARQSSHTVPRGTFTDPRNLVAGPLALIGGGTFTDAATARRFGGNKFPLLVRAGHTVTLSLPAIRAAHRLARLRPAAAGRGGRRDGHPTVTFAACTRGRVAAARADGPRDVLVGLRHDERAALRRARRPRRGPAGAAAPDTRARPPLREAAAAARLRRPRRGPASRSTTAPRARPGRRRPAAVRRASRGEASRARVRGATAAGDVYRVKAGVGVPAGVRATLSIARSARGWAALNYAPRVPGKPRPRSSAAVRFEACAADHPAFSYDGPVGPITGFSGGFDLKRPGCVPLEVRVAGRPTVRARVAVRRRPLLAAARRRRPGERPDAECRQRSRRGSSSSRTTASTAARETARAARPRAPA